MDNSRKSTPLDYAPRRTPTTWLRVIAYVLVSLAFLLLLIFILAPVLPRTLHHHDHRPTSGSHIRQIGQTAINYAVEHDGRFPDSLETIALWEGSYLPPELFASPDGPATPAPDFETLFGEPGHTSYVWIGAGLTIDSVTGATPLVYEGPVTDLGKETHVYFADGSLKRVKGEELRKLLSEADERLKRATTSPATRPCHRSDNRRDGGGGGCDEGLGAPRPHRRCILNQSPGNALGRRPIKWTPPATTTTNGDGPGMFGD